jgi:hypothetical protein
MTGGVSTGETTFVECPRETCPDARFFNADQAALLSVIGTLRNQLNSTALSSRFFLRVCRQVPLARPLTAAGLVGFGCSGYPVEWDSSMVSEEILIFDREAKTELGLKQLIG